MKAIKLQDAGSALATQTTPEFQHEIEQYLYREAALLDDRDWEGWEALFTDDGTYWVPLTHGQLDPLNHASLFYEDGMMREVRRRRLEHVHAWSQLPVTRTARVVGNVMILSGAKSLGQLRVRSTFQLTEWRARRDLRQQAGHYTHSLILVDNQWRIQQKRVDLINCDGIHNALEVCI
ncbi:aromatic-ring-hydroxylating dioxygenase subunit beta [Bradyrhizobium sp. CCBAU 53338]|uniref:aromatic-ring-hydroxylating dioxygenase subunit beta n=1 Tax=Bradyrhizobium sp. CCBAU 53338 TaxID=1325111 RepID=UPI00188C6FAE|nr:aromatic-ring-hydroxylating dioxygenase subunit beta [Bradyrhizobium sp. CCBAU 53338]QOZ52538.1 aromatic-ring-hydroxylating dioxygenase subunit beta [Bradyrhizobium sp. CCBAU 53338]